MKRFLILPLLFLGLTLAAQTQPGDTTQIVLGKTVIEVVKDSSNGKTRYILSSQDETELVVKEDCDGCEENGDGDDDDDKDLKNVDVDLFSMDLGMNLFSYNNSFNLPSELNYIDTRTGRSIHTGLHFLPTRINLINHNVNLVTALDYDINRYSWQRPTTLVPNQDTLTWFQDSVSFKKNKLMAGYLQIPLLLSFDTNPHKKSRNFHFAFGGYAGILVNGRTKQKSDERGRVVVEDNFNMNNIRYGLTARMGFGALDLYCNYNLSTLFAEGQGPEVMPVTFGLCLTGPLGN